MGNNGLDDALSTLPATSFDFAESGDESVLSQLEAKLSGEAVPEIKPKKEKAPQADPEAEIVEETDDQSEEDTEEPEEKAEPEAETEDTLELTQEQVAGILGLEEEGVKITEEGELQLRTKVDGEEAYVPVSELVKSYQLEKHLRAKSQKDAEARKIFEEEKAEVSSKLHSAVTDATALVKYLEESLVVSYPQAEMEKLRQTDPGRWAAANQELQSQRESIKQIKQGLAQTIKAQQTQHQAEMAKRHGEFVARQTAAVLEKLPEWKDPKKAAAGISAMREGMVNYYGFTEDEVSSVNDHRIMMIMLDALKSKVAGTKTEVLKKKLSVIPKLVKPGAPSKTKESGKRKATSDKQLRLRSTGSVDDLAAVLFDRI